MAISFLELIAIDLVRKQVELVTQWAAEQMSDEIGMHLSMRSTRPGFDSPLEAVFDMWWQAMSRMNHIDHGITLVPQKAVEVNGRRYRLDFSVEPTFDYMRVRAEYGVVWPLIGVELDGHDYHERTREQVIQRNERDRDLQSAGWLILHYSGSELVKDPYACLTDCYDKASRAIWAAERHVYSVGTPAERAAENKADAPTTQES